MDNAKEKIQAMKQQIKDYDNENNSDYEGLVKGSSPLARILFTIL